MAWYDRFRANKPKARSPFKRSYAGAQGGRLFADWNASNTSADAEISGALQTLRDRSRALARNDGYISRYLKILSNNVVGHKGIRLSCKARNDDGSLDIQGNQIIESAWSDWSRNGNCTANGRQSFIDCQQLFIESCARDGESLVRHLRSDDKFGYRIQFLEADHLDESYNSKNQDSGKQSRTDQRCSMDFQCVDTNENAQWIHGKCIGQCQSRCIEDGILGITQW